MRTIKRYSNRKLYDTAEKRYITLEGIAGLIRAGHDVEVVENDTGEDLTAVTLSQIIFEQEKRGKMAPQGFFTNLIRFGSTAAPLDLLRRSMTLPGNAFHLIEREVERRLQELVDKGEMAEEQMRRLQADLMGRFNDGERGRDREDVWSRLGLPSRSEVQELNTRLDQLTGRLDELVAVTRDQNERDSGVGEPDMPPPAG